MTPARKRLLQQLMLQCCCGQSGSPGSGVVEPPHGSPPTLPPGIPIANCCFCPDENGNSTVPARMHLDWFDGCIGAREAILEFGDGLPGPKPIPACNPTRADLGLLWTFSESFPNPDPNPGVPPILRCADGTTPVTLACCNDFFRLSCLPGGKCFGLSFIRSRGLHGAVSSNLGLMEIRVHVLSCRPFLGVFNHPADTQYFDQECNRLFGASGSCPPCKGVPIFGVISEA